MVGRPVQIAFASAVRNQLIPDLLREGLPAEFPHISRFRVERIRRHPPPGTVRHPSRLEINTQLSNVPSRSRRMVITELLQLFSSNSSVLCDVVYNDLCPFICYGGDSVCQFFREFYQGVARL